MSAKKLSRKELLDTQDEFLTISEKVYFFIREHSKQFTIGVIAVAALFIAGIGATYYQSYSHKQAVKAYNEAASAIPGLDSQNEEDLMKAAETLTSFVQNYSGSEPALYAQLDLADVYFRMKDYDNALKAYQSFLNNSSTKNSTLAPFVLDSQAFVYEIKGDFDKAEETWKKVLNAPGDTLKPEAYLGLGRTMIAKGDNSEAKKFYGLLVAEYPQSPKVSLAKARLAELSE